MPELLSWGPFAIQTGLLAVVAAGLAALVAVRAMSRPVGPAAGHAADAMQSAALLALVVWKFGHVLFAPSVVWERPEALLMLNGGTREAVLAVAAAIAYGYAASRRKGIPARLVLDLAACGAVAATIVYVMIDWRYGKPTAMPWGIVLNDPAYRYHPVSGYMLLVALAAAIRLWRGRASAGTGELFRYAALHMGIGLLAVSIWDAAEPSLLFLSGAQWRGLALAGIGIVSSFPTHNKGRKEMTSMSTKQTNTQDSAAQRRQAEQNERNRQDTPAGEAVDKKLDGPNRPSV